MAVATSNQELSIPLKEPDLIVERARMIHWLTSKFQAAGGELYLGHCFTGFQQRNKGLGILLQTSKGQSIAVAKEAVIGADGIRSQVAADAGIPKPDSVPIVQAEVTLSSEWDPSVAKVWFDTGETRFFFWLVPESPNKAVVGLIGHHGMGVRERLKQFLAQHNLEPEAYQAAQVAMYSPRLKPWTRIGRTPVYLVGDAAGQVKVTTVGGTVSGFLGAGAAATALLNGKSYRTRLLGVRRELNLHWLLRRLLDRLDNRGYDQLASTVTLKVRNFLSRYDRDSMAPVLWRLPILEPRSLKVLRNCLRGKPRTQTATNRQNPVCLPK